jgi:hypothetical protein
MTVHIAISRHSTAVLTCALYYKKNIIIIICLYSPLLGIWPIFSFLILYTVGRTPWTGDQTVARPLPIHRTTQTQNKRTSYRHPCLDHSLRASEDISGLRPRAHRDRHFLIIATD